MWYLKKTDDTEYGPEDMETLRRWAAESRVVSGNRISRDRKEWTAVEDVPELEMNWLAELPDGRRYGPFNIEATKDLHGHKVLPESARVVHRQTGQTLTVREYLDGGLPRVTPPADTPEEDAPDGGDPAAGAARKTKRRTRRTTDEAQGSLWMAPPEELTQPSEEPKSNVETAMEESEKRVTDETPALNARLAELEQALAVAKEEAEAGARELAEARETARQTEAALRENARTADAGRTEALKKAETARKTLEEMERALEESRRREESERQARETFEQQDASENVAREQQLEAALAELKTARADEQAATAALAREQAGDRKHLVAAETRLKDLLQERNTLTELMEVENGRIRRWKGVAIALAVLWLLTLVVFSSKLRGPKAARPETAAVAREQQAGSPAAAAAAPPPRPPPTSPAPAPRSPVPPVTGPAAGRPAAPAAPAAPLVMPIIGSVKGVHVVYDRSGCTVTFDQGVFSSGVNISPWATTVMRDLAPKLVPYLDRFTLVVEGHTDRSPVRRDSRFGSNETLALDRARAFARYLTKTHGIAPARMKVVASTDAAPPHPETDAVGRARNRTVVLKLVRHASN